MSTTNSSFQSNNKKNVNQNVNQNIENFVRKTSEHIRTFKRSYDSVKAVIDQTPLQIKIVNIVLPFSLCYVFSYFYYHLPLSIFFAIITFLIMFIMSKLIAVIFLILYIVSIINITNNRNITVGNPILQTDIVKNKTPFDCAGNNLVIPFNQLPKDLNGGYFTYSFWIYINGNNSLHKYTWDNYRNSHWKSIFYRGNAVNPQGDLTNLVQFPGFWLKPKVNDMVIVFNNGSYVERLEINNIELNKWTAISVVVETKSVSVYVNGLLERTLNLYQPITLMNNYHLYIGSDQNTDKNKLSGFPGSIAELIFYNYALTPHNIFQSYLYYKEIVHKYQKNQNSKYNYSIPNLITNNDYFNKKG
jgi:hypothetical protein